MKRRGGVNDVGLSNKNLHRLSDWAKISFLGQGLHFVPNTFIKRYSIPFICKPCHECAFPRVSNARMFIYRRAAFNVIEYLINELCVHLWPVHADEALRDAVFMAAGGNGGRGAAAAERYQ